jgi:hypothetical protein
MICRSIPGARCTSSKQKDCQLVVVGAGVVVPVVYHCTLHWPHTHRMYKAAREPTQTPRKVDEWEVEGVRVVQDDE